MRILEYSKFRRTSSAAVLSAAIISLSLGVLQYLFFLVGGLYLIASVHPLTPERSNTALGVSSAPIPFAALLGLFAVCRARSHVERIIGSIGFIIAVGWAVYAVRFIQ
jgi:hypothetical protein